MTTNAAVIKRMQTLIDAWEAADDRRAIFLSCYAMMTRNMLVAVEQSEFQDAVWVKTLLHRFADYYFDAVEAYENRRACSLVWHFVFETARNPHAHTMQHLILGVNAHIGYDLVLALVDVLQTEWGDLSPVQREQRYQDHCHVNTIIAGTINSVQDQVIERYSPAMDVVDKLFGPVDEWLIAQLITTWREEVWQHAGNLLACTDNAASAALRQKVEHNAMTRAHAIAGKRGIMGILDLV